MASSWKELTDQERIHRMPENTLHSGRVCPQCSETNPNEVLRGGRCENFESELEARSKGIDEGTGGGKSRHRNVVRRKHHMEKGISLGCFLLHATKMLQGAGGAHSTLLTK